MLFRLQIPAAESACHIPEDLVHIFAVLSPVDDLGRKRADATGEDDHGNTVSEAFLGDLVTKPHGKHGTREDDSYDVGVSPEVAIEI